MRLCGVLSLAVAVSGLAPTVQRKEVVLASGQRIEWLSAEPRLLPWCPPAPVAVCVHGTFHGAWCWAEEWLPRFADRGVDAFALSLRGTSGSPCEEKAVALGTHAADLAEAVASEVGGDRAVYLVAHSFGGPVATEAVAAGRLRAAGVAALCAVPPAGNGPGTKRVLRRSLRDAWAITRAFALKTAASSPRDANAIFFNGALDADTAAAYAARFRADSTVGLDLGDFTRSLPRWPTDAAGRWTERPADLDALVVGCGADAVVDAVAVGETAAFYGVAPTTLPGAPHDLMLAPDVARPAADLVADWILESHKRRR